MAHITQELYVATGGQNCPCCNSSDVSGGQVQVDAGIAWQEVTCYDCGAGWNDQYALTGYQLVEEPTNNDEEE